MMRDVKNTLWIAQKQFSESQVKIPTCGAFFGSLFSTKRWFIWNLVHLKWAAKFTKLGETRTPLLLPI